MGLLRSFCVETFYSHGAAGEYTHVWLPVGQRGPLGWENVEVVVYLSRQKLVLGRGRKAAGLRLEGTVRFGSLVVFFLQLSM